MMTRITMTTRNQGRQRHQPETNSPRSPFSLLVQRTKSSLPRIHVQSISLDSRQSTNITRQSTAFPLLGLSYKVAPPTQRQNQRRLEAVNGWSQKPFQLDPVPSIFERSDDIQTHPWRPDTMIEASFYDSVRNPFHVRGNPPGTKRPGAGPAAAEDAVTGGIVCLAALTTGPPAGRGTSTMQRFVETDK